MIAYEYKCVYISLNEDELHIATLGVAEIKHVNNLVLEIANEQGADGWEAMYPFSIPAVWFKRQKTVRKKSA